MEGYKIPRDQVLAEYEAMHRPPVTPLTHPELFDPLNPPDGWIYDEWHAIWYKSPIHDDICKEIKIIHWTLVATFLLVACASIKCIFFV
jgi:hypothetical protein